MTKNIAVLGTGATGSCIAVDLMGRIRRHPHRPMARAHRGDARRRPAHSDGGRRAAGASARPPPLRRVHLRREIRRRIPRHEGLRRRLGVSPHRAVSPARRTPRRNAKRDDGGGDRRGRGAVPHAGLRLQRGLGAAHTRHREADARSRGLLVRPRQPGPLHRRPGGGGRGAPPPRPAWRWSPTFSRRNG